MILIIDGYNLLRQIFPGFRGKMDQQRDLFIRQLGYYKFKKSAEIREIIIVFDAGPFSHASREVHHGVVVMFSGQKRSADDWIVEYVEKHRNEEILVVTNDRKIISEILKHNSANLSCCDFYRILQDVITFRGDKCQTGGKNLQKKAVSSVKKFDQADYADENIEGLELGIDLKAVDILMEEASGNVNKPDFVDDSSDKRTRAADKLSKQERKLYSKLKKMY